MLAAEQDQTEQELPESICQPRHVRHFALALNAALSACNALERVRPFPRESEAGRGSWPGEAVLAE
jgi:hypothetical protein